mmetsp:Transcript_7359/g.13237  ORF Transcript_7359/g.13237 Transcript_7359/m.13237 type:complete len:372 (-) Transcript_7359:376-1491(-)|eukprot:CAMPEP_0198287234 /NCGR_PEP_ID=MMETSP1449-20131203/6129_1 /TAXON_ID=420275 /ORGANISM="Attheya septentrionalis, Strain CCMP2084" /LENGTH=371 /DNA_ID=CAMNT_0043985167 /DNA_START=184 /DNA_END=1299 /DNA_ORIENTATION=-
MVAFTKIVIAGGGIVGNAIAYYLAKQNVCVTLVDPVGIAPAASAKAGGFLARQWRDSTPLQEMQQKGFDLHQELANELGAANIDYRRLTCATIAVDESKGMQKPSNRKLRDVEWVDSDIVLDTSPMGDTSNIAQVHPRKLCEAMWEFSEKAGSCLKIGRVVNVEQQNGCVTGVKLEDGSVIEADAVVVACGPWTHEARSWFSSSNVPPVTGVKCHSMLVRAPRVLQQAVFFQSNGVVGDGGVEVYPRPDGDCYVNGFEGDEVICTERPGSEEVEQKCVDLLQEALAQTSTEVGQLQPHTTQACYWPETPDGYPLIGPIPGVQGGFVAAGHSVWGILQGPVTGKAVAELLIDGSSTTLDLDSFSLQRFGSFS